jgi:hypothetical protein
MRSLIICASYDDQIKLEESGRACITHGSEEKFLKVLVIKLEGRNHLIDLDVYG